MEKRWVIQDFDRPAALALQQAFEEQGSRLHPVIYQLLVERGITTFDEARRFFRPHTDQLHDPFLMRDMSVAVERLRDAFRKGERIMVYGDYDVDGTTSVALVYSYLKSFYPNINYYIPNRYNEGYGISVKGIDTAKERGVTLIVALDCGIKSVENVAYADSLGIDFIICDHHLPGDILPKAVAVLDPKRHDCDYPFKELSGCGIGFKLIQAIALDHGHGVRELMPYLDLVAVSIASDIVPLVGENRILAHYGLKVLNTKPRQGLAALIEATGLHKGALTINDVVFTLGPRINAAGRIDEATWAVKLLVSETTLQANDHAETLNRKNLERREFDSSITEEAFAIVDADPNKHLYKSTVLYRPYWNKGVIGIVASRLLDRYYRPTVMLTDSNGTVAGSARSVNGFDIYKAIKECSDLLDQFGGHMYAAGLTMPRENVPAFIEKFEHIVSTTISDRNLTPEINVDAELDFKDISFNLFRVLHQFEPFGPGNMKPIFITRGVHDTGWSRVVKDLHLKISVKHNGSRIMNGIGFGMAEKQTILAQPAFDICYHIEENNFSEEKKLELRLMDLREAVAEQTDINIRANLAVAPEENTTVRVDPSVNPTKD